MTELKPCTVKGCTSAEIHHHIMRTGRTATGCGLIYGGECAALRGGWPDWSEPVAPAAPRLTRKALAARLAAVEAENADLHAEIADKADRLARLEKAEEPESLVNLAVQALADSLRAKEASDATQFVRVLDTIVQDGLNRLTATGEVPF